MVAAGKTRIEVDLEFLPSKLLRQCLLLVEQYHHVHGYGCLPDILWCSGPGAFIEQTAPFGQRFSQAAKTRSAKRSNSLFAEIAVQILALKILASSFFAWSGFLKRQKGSYHS